MELRYEGRLMVADVNGEVLGADSMMRIDVEYPPALERYDDSRFDDIDLDSSMPVIWGRQ